MKSLIIVGTVLAATSAFAQPKEMDITDFLVDADLLKGKSVLVSRCQMRYATVTQVMCGAQAGDFWLDGKSMQREDLRRAVKECGTYNNSPQCLVTVAGTVVIDSNSIKMRSVKVHWPDTIEAQ